MSKKQSTSQEISRESTAPNAFKKYGTWCILIGILIAIGIFMNREFDLIPSKISDTVDSTSKSVILGMSEPTDSIEKISYDTKILSIALDTPIATGSISRESVTLSPALSGTVSVSSDQKTISYTLQSPLIIGESYELRVA